MGKIRQSITQTYLFLIKDVERDKLLKNHEKIEACWSIKGAYRAIMDNKAAAFNNRHIPIILKLNKKSELLIKSVTGRFSYEN